MLDNCFVINKGSLNDLWSLPSCSNGYYWNGNNCVVCSIITSIPSSSYFSSVCYGVTNSDTGYSPCTTVMPNYYVSSLCVQGSSIIQGSDLIQTSCSPSNGYYVTFPCIQGNYSSPGTSFNQAACASPSIGQYVISFCIPGNSSFIGSNTGISSCSSSSNGFYTSSLCKGGNI